MEDLVNKLHQRLDAMNLKVKDSIREIVDVLKSQDEKIDFVREKTEILESAVHTLQADTSEAMAAFHMDECVEAIPAAPTRCSTTGLGIDSGSAQVMATSPPLRDVSQAPSAPLEATPVSVSSLVAVLGHASFTPARCSTKCSGNYNSVMMPRFAPCVSPLTALLLTSTHLNTTMPFVRVRVCTGTKDVATHMLIDEVPEQVEVGWRPWPPPVQVCIRTKERMPWTVLCPSFAADFACLLLKIPWPLLRRVSNIAVLSCIVMKKLQQCRSKGLTETTCANLDSHGPQSLGNHPVSSGFSLSNDLCDPCVLWAVETWWPEIQKVQQVSAFLDNAVGAGYGYQIISHGDFPASKLHDMRMIAWGCEQWDPGIHLVCWWLLLSKFHKKFLLKPQLQLVHYRRAKSQWSPSMLLVLSLLEQWEFAISTCESSLEMSPLTQTENQLISPNLCVFDSTNFQTWPCCLVLQLLSMQVCTRNWNPGIQRVAGTYCYYYYWIPMHIGLIDYLLWRPSDVLDDTKRTLCNDVAAKETIMHRSDHATLARSIVIKVTTAATAMDQVLVLVIYHYQLIKEIKRTWDWEMATWLMPLPPIQVGQYHIKMYADNIGALWTLFIWQWKVLLHIIPSKFSVSLLRSWDPGVVQRRGLGSSRVLRGGTVTPRLCDVLGQEGMDLGPLVHGLAARDRPAGRSYKRQSQLRGRQRRNSSKSIPHSRSSPPSSLLFF